MCFIFWETLENYVVRLVFSLFGLSVSNSRAGRTANDLTIHQQRTRHKMAAGDG